MVDLSLLPLLSLMMILSIVTFVIESNKKQDRIEFILAQEDNDKSQKQLIRMAIGESFPDSIGTGHLFVPAVILTLIGNVPAWVFWIFWAFFGYNCLMTILKLSIPSDPEAFFKEDTRPVWAAPMGFVGLGLTSLVAATYFYTVYAAWVIL